ncbi:MAG: enoyl-CoA hydratase/isomerase family protein [Thermodesulfobacteriota bacterium]|nr:enoyl-CoA hydratase/isomerase family protein [Thermodesulfobacteriota bacterium]
MSLITVEMKGAVAIVRLNNGILNSLSPDLSDELRETLGRVKAEARAMVLAGGDKFFSNGLDLPTLLKLEKDEMIEFYEGFNQASLDLFTLPMPTIAAVVGHAAAGGAVLAMMCDYRFVAAGKTKIGVNEARIGVALPYLSNLVLRQIVGDRVATDMAFTGRFLGPDQALAAGLADEIHPPGEVEDKALEKMTSLASLSPAALAANKTVRVEEIHNRYTENDKGRRSNKADIDIWYEPEIRNLLAETAKKL